MNQSTKVELTTMDMFSQIAVTQEEQKSPNPKDLEIAIHVSEKIKQLLSNALQKVILFGSRARGDADEESDFDFLIVADFDEPSVIDRGVEISRHVGYFGYAVDYLPVTEVEFETKILIRKAILKEGVILYDRGH